MTDELEQATILNSFFSPVFTKDDATDYELPLTRFSEEDNIRLTDIDITRERVRQKLKKLDPTNATGVDGISSRVLVVEKLRDHLGWYCADLSTSMTFGTHVDQTILNSFFESAKAGGHWGRHNRKIQYGRQPILYLVITS